MPRLNPSFGATAFCLAALLLQLLVFWPGYVSFDVLSQLEQGRSGLIYDISPPANALLLGGFDRLVAGTGLLFGLNALLFWGALAAVLTALPLRRAHLWLLPGLFPLLPLLPHAWSDLHLLSVLALASALILHALRAADPKAARWLWIGALLVLAWSTWVRHNALLAALPLALLVALVPARPGNAAGWVRRGLQAAGVLVLLLLVRAGSGLVVDRPVSVWAVTPMWDLQALSLRAGRVLLPPALIGPGLDVDELRAAFSPNTAVPLFARTPSGVADPTVERFDPARRDALLSAWADAVRVDPGGWLAHRWTVFRRLFGAHRQGDLQHMVDSPEFLAGEAPAGWRGALHQRVRQAIEAAKRWGLLAPAPALLLGAALFVAGRRGGAGRAPELQWALLASALVYLLALFPLTPSAEQRYLAWPLWAVLAAAALALARPSEGARPEPPLSR